MKLQLQIEDKFNANIYCKTIYILLQICANITCIENKEC